MPSRPYSGLERPTFKILSWEHSYSSFGPRFNFQSPTMFSISKVILSPQEWRETLRRFIKYQAKIPFSSYKVILWCFFSWTFMTFDTNGTRFLTQAIKKKKKDVYPCPRRNVNRATPGNKAPRMDRARNTLLHFQNKNAVSSLYRWWRRDGWGNRTQDLTHIR